MKTTRAIYILIGWLCIAVNGIGYIAVVGMPKPYFKNKTIPFIIGFNFWFAAGFVLLLLANGLKRKIRRKGLPEEFG